MQFIYRMSLKKWATLLSIKMSNINYCSPFQISPLNPKLPCDATHFKFVPLNPGVYIKPLAHFKFAPLNPGVYIGRPFPMKCVKRVAYSIYIHLGLRGQIWNEQHQQVALYMYIHLFMGANLKWAPLASSFIYIYTLVKGFKFESSYSS